MKEDEEERTQTKERDDASKRVLHFVVLKKKHYPKLFRCAMNARHVELKII